jgi:hypothetical protein
MRGRGGRASRPIRRDGARLVRRVLRIRTSMKGRIGALREPSVLAKVRVDRPIGLRWPLDVLCSPSVRSSRDEGAALRKGRPSGTAD